MRYIEVYVYEVTRRLPEKTREDIALELRSSILDMLPEQYTEEEEKNVLAKLGDPAELAASYRDTPMYLIGPKVYDAYIHTLKRVAPWAIFLTVLIHLVQGIVGFAGEESILSAVLNTLGLIISKVIMTLIQVFFWFTIVFIAIERIGLSNVDGPLTKKKGTWNPDDLKDIEMVPKKKLISNGEIIFGFIWTLIWAVVYFNADRLLGVYSVGLEFVMPLLDQEVWLSYWPMIVGFIILEVGLLVYKWKAKQWTMKLVVGNGIIHLLGGVVFIVMASNPAIINEAVIPYMTDLFETTSTSVTAFIEGIRWFIVAAAIIPIFIELFDSYRKAK